MEADERRKLFSPADSFLTWAVGRDLQQSLKSQGWDFDLEEIMRGSEKELPVELLPSLTRKQRILGEGLFRYASAFILLHELAHLSLGHISCKGDWSIHQEKEADCFAADWLLDSRSFGAPDPHRMNVLIGMAVALLWLTVLNVYLGPHENETHPEGYDRLFQVLDHAINRDNENESSIVWFFVSNLLFVHMDNAGFDFDGSKMQGSPRDEVNYLIDILSKK
jgi:hypothetical protein